MFPKNDLPLNLNDSGDNGPKVAAPIDDFPHYKSL